MNFSTLLGFISSIAVFSAAVMLSMKNLKVIFDLHAILIVIGGTCAASLVCFSLPKLFSLFRVFVRRMLGKSQIDYIGVVSQLTALSQASFQGPQAFEAQIEQTRDLFLRDAAKVLSWIEADVPPEQLRELLEMRAETHYEQYMDEANVFRTIAKFPPAFGLMGTTLGMIALLQSLGSANAQKTIGPSMAIGLVATLYGIALTNFILIPIAENLTKQTKEDRVSRNIVVEGIMLIHGNLPTKFVEEKVLSFLLPTQRQGNGQNRTAA